MALQISSSREGNRDAFDAGGADQELPASLPESERRLLLSTPGIGVGVVARLEAAGVRSLAQLQGDGLDILLSHICRQKGNDAFLNRRRALRRAVARANGWNNNTGGLRGPCP